MSPSKANLFNRVSPFPGLGLVVTPFITIAFSDTRSSILLSLAHFTELHRTPFCKLQLIQLPLIPMHGQNVQFKCQESVCGTPSDELRSFAAAAVKIVQMDSVAHLGSRPQVRAGARRNAV